MNTTPISPQYADDEPEVELASVRGIAGLIPYENFTGLSTRAAAIGADQLLREGWSNKGRFPLLKLDDQFPWDDDTPEHRSWNFTIHSLTMIQDLLLAHSKTGLDKYLKPALRISLDWATHHPSLSVEGRSQFAWYDMAVGLRAQRLAYVADAARRTGMADEPKVKVLLDSLELHRQYLADDEKIVFHNNHGFYQAAGQMAMGRRFRAERPEMAEAFAQGNLRFKAMLEAQFTNEGVHKEHSPDYHRMVYDSLRGIVDSGLVENPDVIELAHRIEDSLAWFILPTGDVVNFGDSDLRSVLRHEAEAVRKWSYGPMQFMASRGLIGAPPAERYRAFSESGYFVARDRWPAGPDDYAGGSYLALAAAFHSRTHKHADDLSFVWYDKGQEILVDAGRYGYMGKAEVGSDLWEDGYWYSDPARVYVESTAAHNTVEIDGRNHPRKGVKPYGSALGRFGEGPGGLVFCESEVRHFKSIRHARVLVLKPGHWLVVFDWLQDNHSKPHDFRQWFHFSPAVSVLPSGLGYVAHVPDAEKLLRVESLLATSTPSRLELGREAEPMQGFYSPKEKQLLPNYALAYEALATDWAGFATLFCFCDDLKVVARENTMARSGRTGTFQWMADGRRHTLRINRMADEPMNVSYSGPADNG